jgi:hypothetical protein
MTDAADTGSSGPMASQILLQKIELVNVALGHWLRPDLRASLVHDERRATLGVRIADEDRPRVPTGWLNPMTLHFLEMEEDLIADIVSARAPFLPLVMELFELEELVILDPVDKETPTDIGRVASLFRRLREIGFRSPRAALGRRLGAGVSVRYARLTYKAEDEQKDVATLDKSTRLPMGEIGLSTKRKLATA